MEWKVRVIAPWRASYDAPIAVAAGAALALSGREDWWDGHLWLWARAGGREGWVPDSLVTDAGTAAFDYDAAELSCAVGEVLRVTRETHGWAWCEAGAGRAGWVPVRCLAPA